LQVRAVAAASVQSILSHHRDKRCTVLGDYVGAFCSSVLRGCTAKESAQTLLLIEFLKAGLPLLPTDHVALVCDALLRLATLAMVCCVLCVSQCVPQCVPQCGCVGACFSIVLRLPKFVPVSLRFLLRLSARRHFGSLLTGCVSRCLQPRVTSLALSVVTNLLKSPLASLKMSLLRGLVRTLLERPPPVDDAVSTLEFVALLSAAQIRFASSAAEKVARGTSAGAGAGAGGGGGVPHNKAWDVLPDVVACLLSYYEGDRKVRGGGGGWVGGRVPTEASCS
jgi:hypothetical protein